MLAGALSIMAGSRTKELRREGNRKGTAEAVPFSVVLT
jgi:hypothetical protein